MLTSDSTKLYIAIVINFLSFIASFSLYIYLTSTNVIQAQAYVNVMQ